ncbi:MAG: hypothetical protein JW882_05405, partial [Deltaproteobacteria bacterium]|nr:hypothetical protein [Deltaproteobacteria bacterium]
ISSLPKGAQFPPLRGGFPVSEALHLDIVRQPPKWRLLDSLLGPPFKRGEALVPLFSKEGLGEIL